VSWSQNSPCSPETRHWGQLEVLLRRQPDFAALLLHTPPATIPDPETVHVLTEIAGSAGLEELLAKHLLAGLLLTPCSERMAWPEEIRDPLLERLQDMDPDTALGSHWIRVPILTVQGRKACLVWMLLARLPEGRQVRCLGRPVPDSGTREDIRRALEQADPEHGFCYWFLQQDGAPPVSGGSLALPVALAALLLKEKKEWPGGLYATGTLAEWGVIGPVGHVREKYRAAGQDCRLFLLPVEGRLHADRPSAWFACQGLDDAWFAVRLHAGGVGAGSIALCRAACCSVRELMAGFHRLPLAFLRSAACADLLRQAGEDIPGSLPLLADTLWRCSSDMLRGPILADLLSPDDIRVLPAGHADPPPDPVYAAFRWCLARISLANHQGDVRASTTWADVADQLRPRVDPEEIGHLVTRNMVTGRFNRYEFRPDPPEEFREALRVEEKRWQIDRRANPLLGAMYGTLAQNYGFCGPACLGRLFDAAKRAEDAFGRKHWQEGRRMYNYRIYGLLDAGKPEEAARLLPAYLGVAQGSGPGCWFATACRLLRETDNDVIFRATLVLRLLADAGWQTGKGSRLREIIDTIVRAEAHPWQLIALNLGRILAAGGQLQAAERLFRQAVAICEKGGATMRPMALLPLAELHAAGSAGEADFRKAGEIRAWLWRTDDLHRPHFQTILGLTDGGDLLRSVHCQRGRLFPFSYR